MKGNSSAVWLVAVSLVLVLTAGIASAATVTNSISFSGILTNSGGTPLTGTSTVTFRLYNVASGGTALAVDTHLVTADKGQYTTTLNFPAGNYNGQALWVGIQRSPDAEKSPRTVLVPVAYAQSLRPGAVVSGSTSLPVLSVSNGAGVAVYGAGGGASGYGVFGYSPNNIGVRGEGAQFGLWGKSTSGTAVYGASTSSYGVHGDSVSSFGIVGESQTGNGTYGSSTTGSGVYGSSVSGTGVAGFSKSSTGVYGNGLSNYGVVGNGTLAGVLGMGADKGVSGISTKSSGTGVYGQSTSGTGVYGKSSGTGVYGESTSSGNGVYGKSSSGVGVYGIGKEGAYFTTNQAGTFSSKVAGVNVSTSFNYNPGIYVKTSGSDSPGIKSIGVYSDGVWGESDTHNGVFGKSIRNHGVYGLNVGTLTSSYGVAGYGVNSSGVWGFTQRSDHKYGVLTPDIIRALGYETGASDVAEYMQVSGDATPGTVLVIGTDGKLRISSSAYDAGVAGIVSTAPGMSLGAKEEGNPGEALVAVAGRVPCNVDASNGPIHPRDLLTTSNTPGYAMKATDPKIGTVLGKAMGSLESGTGTIEVLVTLQ